MSHQSTVDEGKVKRPKPATEERINEHLADSQRDPTGLIELQKTVGNRAVQRLLAQRSGDGAFELDDETASRINQDRGGGQPLEGRVQQQAGEAMGQDFSGVRVHDSSEANDLSQELNAKAFTTGQDIFFREGAYEPNSSSGQELIAHELAHVVQQGSGAVGDGGGGMTVNPPGDAFEQEADDVAKAVTSPGNVPGVNHQDTVQRYQLREGDSRYLTEQRFVKGVDEIQFGGFDSCLGVVVLNTDNKLSGVHLVVGGRLDSKGEKIEWIFESTEGEQKALANAIVEELGDAKSGLIFGFLKDWIKESPYFINALKEGLATTKGGCTFKDKPKGAWKVTYDEKDGWKTDEAEPDELWGKTSEIRDKEAAEDWESIPHV